MTYSQVWKGIIALDEGDTLLKWKYHLIDSCGFCSVSVTFAKLRAKIESLKKRMSLKRLILILINIWKVWTIIIIKCHYDLLFILFELFWSTWTFQIKTGLLVSNKYLDNLQLVFEKNQPKISWQILEYCQ